MKTLNTAIYISEIPSEFLYQVRNIGLDAQKQPVMRYRSETGGEPCRDVLRRARPGEEVILASFCPFTKSGPFKEYGPIYVLADPLDEAVPRNELPLVQPEPEPYLRKQFALRAYNDSEEIIDAALVKSTEAEEVLDRFLMSLEVTFVDARFPTYGCFALRIQRSSRL
jgi:hypothetical protein